MNTQLSESYLAEPTRLDALADYLRHEARSSATGSRDQCMSDSRMKLGIVLVFMLLGFTPSCNRTKTVYVVFIGRLATIPVSELTRYYRDRFGISVEELPLLRFDEATYDPARHQFMAEALIAQMKQSYLKQAQDENAILIGITDGDMYLRKMDWQFGFSYRQEGRFAVVSCARMDPTNFGLPADDELLRSRLRKMVTKNIGIMYFNKAPSTNPKSVLYNNVLGLEELDYMGEEF